MFALKERHPHLLKQLLLQCLLSTQRAHLHFPHQLFQGSTELSLAAQQPRLHDHHSQPATGPAAQGCVTELQLPPHTVQGGTCGAAAHGQGTQTPPVPADSTTLHLLLCRSTNFLRGNKGELHNVHTAFPKPDSLLPCTLCVPTKQRQTLYMHTCAAMYNLAGWHVQSANAVLVLQRMPDLCDYLPDFGIKGVFWPLQVQSVNGCCILLVYDCYCSH